ncbi:hypothetical protein B0A48_00878 [Cryoendolithus antarcticus]|uniref:FAD/NAD(P)-binding domain-containing protein n=1 Tax=Cryoendolithus antarcticus TaxID=1507870 RepID=A0A1V8TRL1_9PEZI|nr:hypothetical protein B0A48_00878 [Cryoendolithus antarcticus]
MATHDADPLLLQANAHDSPNHRRTASNFAPPPTPGHRPPSLHSKAPTGTAAESLNIVILGASFGGLSCAHALLDDIWPQLRTTSTAPNYRLIIISPSTHIYWNIGAPRALVAPGLVSVEEVFIPLEPGFHRYRGLPVTFIQGTVIAWEVPEKLLTIDLHDRAARARFKTVRPRNTCDSDVGIQSLEYHALILATGTSAHSDLLSLHGTHLNTLGALSAAHHRLAGAKTIIVGGGGCSGVEVAGQLATYLNYRGRGVARRSVKKEDWKRILLIASTDALLPGIKPKVGQKAIKALKALGIEVRLNTRIVAVKEDFDLTGQVKVELDDKTAMVVDAYIACTGVFPNTKFVPKHLLDGKGYVATNSKTMRLDKIGYPGVFALGDCAAYSSNYVMDVYTAVPIVLHNLLNDLLAHELRLASPYGGNQDQIDSLVDEEFVQRDVNSHLCPISRYGGVGWLLGNVLPGFAVWAFKGHDYRVCKAGRVVVDGGNPYAKPVGGTRWE